MNTLGDNADDIQRQLDNEAKDRIKFGRPQTIWILQYPSKCRRAIELATTETMKLQRNYVVSQRVTNFKDIPTPKGEKGSLKKLSHKCRRTECSTVVINKDVSLGVVTSYPIVFDTPVPNDYWNYKDQLMWPLTYPSCQGRSQSPVNLPFSGLLRTKAWRKMLFRKYNLTPKSMTLVHDGETVYLTGDWGSDRPYIYGGAAYSRRYVFHSLAIRRPSEHTVGQLYYPMESQAIHVSGEYGKIDEALRAAPKDKSALLIVANIYKHSAKNHEGLEELIQTMLTASGNMTLKPRPLKVFSPPLKQYAAYHGSLTSPPCTEAVLWLVRARALPITRKVADVLENVSYSKPGMKLTRDLQPLNDRKIYYFN